MGDAPSGPAPRSTPLCINFTCRCRCLSLALVPRAHTSCCWTRDSDRYKVVTNLVLRECFVGHVHGRSCREHQCHIRGSRTRLKTTSAPTPTWSSLDQTTVGSISSAILGSRIFHPPGLARPLPLFYPRSRRGLAVEGAPPPMWWGAHTALLAIIGVLAMDICPPLAEDGVISHGTVEGQACGTSQLWGPPQ